MIGYGGAARIRDWSKVNFVGDGDSLMAGNGASSSSMAMIAQLATLAPIGGVITPTNVGFSGQTTRQMDGLDGGSSADVDGAFAPGKMNVLVLFGEPTNAIFNAGRTSDQSISDMQTYIANRRAANRWSAVVIGTTLPRQSGTLVSGQASIVTYNGYLDDYNAKLKVNYRAIGADNVVDIRQAGSPFALVDYTAASFAANDQLWSEAAGSRIHLTDAGYAIIAGYFAAEMRRLPLRLAA